MIVDKPTYGILAEFRNPEELLQASKLAYEAGYREMDAYTPFPVEGMSEAIGVRRDAVPLITFLGALTGTTTAFVMQWYASVIDYPINIGGRPYFSWPAFIIITFELTVLFGALSAAIGMLALNRLPMPHHPVFNAVQFLRASTDRFFLCIQAQDPLFDQDETPKFMSTLHPERVIEVRDEAA